MLRFSVKKATAWSAKTWSLSRAIHINVPKTQNKALVSSILKDLNLDPNSPNPGVFNGEWGGSGIVRKSINPATNEVIASVQEVFSNALSFSLPNVQYCTD
jgi:aldehyde dehydrogenase family 7 protein A1